MKISRYDLLCAFYMGVLLCASGYEWDGIGTFHKLVMLVCGIGIYYVGYRSGRLEDSDDNIQTDEEQSVKPYIEQDTMCDKCWMLNKCCIEEGIVVETTTNFDTRRHYVPVLGGHCPGFVGDRNYAFRNKEVLDDDNNKQIQT